MLLRRLDIHFAYSLLGRLDIHFAYSLLGRLDIHFACKEFVDITTTTVSTVWSGSFSSILGYKYGVK